MRPFTSNAPLDARRIQIGPREQLLRSQNNQIPHARTAYVPQLIRDRTKKDPAEETFGRAKSQSYQAELTKLAAGPLPGA